MSKETLGRRTSDLTLTFLDTHTELPRRFFSASWHGYWFLPRAGTVDLYAGGDDGVDVWLDGRLIHRRGGRNGTNTTSERIALDAGAHELLVEYWQLGGSSTLHVLWAPAGGTPRPFAPDQLFPTPPSPKDFRFTRGVTWLGRMAVAVWVIPLVALVAIASRYLWLVAAARVRRVTAAVPWDVTLGVVLGAAGLGVGIAAVLARLPGWDPESLWSDDLVWGAIIRSQDLWSMLAVPIPAPPGLFVLLRGSYAVFGDPEWSLQLLPFVCGIAAIPVMALVARNLTGSNGLAVLAAALTALNPLLAHYTVFVHHYSFEFLVTALLLLSATWLLIGEGPRQQHFGSVATLSGLGIFFSITSVLASFPIVNLAALSALRGWSSARRRTLAVLGWAGLYNLLVLAGYVLLRNRSNEAARVYFRGGFLDPSSLASAGQFLGDNGRRLIETSLPSWVAVEPWNPVTVSWTTPFVFLGFAWLLARRQTRLFGLAVAGFYAAFLLASALQIYPLGMGRTDIFAFPVGICLLVAGVHLVTESVPRAALVRAAVGVTAAAIAIARPIPVSYWPVNDVHLVRYLSAAARPSDGVILSPSGVSLTAFYGNWPVTIFATDQGANAVQAVIGRDRTVHLPRGGVSPVPFVAALLDEAHPARVWYVAFRTGESTQVLRTLAEHGYVTQEVQQTRKGTLYLAVSFAASAPPERGSRQPDGPRAPGPRSPSGWRGW